METSNLPEPFRYALDWLIKEREYQIDKFSYDQNDAVVVDGVKAGSYWDQQLQTYWSRMEVLGFDTPGGRQPAAKFAATALGLLESIYRVYGSYPAPGVPSGENLDTEFKVSA